MSNIYDKTVTGFLCTVAWEHEVGNTDAKVYHSVDSLKRNCKCYPECGIIEVSMKYVKTTEDEEGYKH